MAMSNDDSPASGSVNDVDNDGMNHAHTLSSTHTIPQSHHTHAHSHLPLHPHPQEQQQNRGLLSPETDLDLRYSENLRPNLVDRLSGSVPEGRENNTVDGEENDLGMSMDELSNPEYTARRASTTSTMSASGASSVSTRSMHSTISTATTSTALSGLSSITAATSHSALSSGLSVPSSSLKRGVSPEDYDYDYDYPASEYSSNSVIRAESPRGAKRARPTLNLGSSGSQIPVSSRPVSAGGPGCPSIGSEANRAHHAPLFSYTPDELELGRDDINLGESASAPPTSHGPGSSSGSTSSSNSALSTGPYFGQTQSADYSGSGFSFSPAEHLSSPLNLNDIRRGSLPSLYSTSLATRGMNTSTLGLAPGLLSQRSTSSSGSVGSSNYAYGNGSGYEGSPQSDGGLSAYQFPPIRSSENNASNAGSGHGSTPSSGATPTGAMGSPFPMNSLSQTTPTSGLSSTPSSSFPQTPLDITQRPTGDQQKGYRDSCSNKEQQEEMKEMDRFERDYLNLDVNVTDRSGSANGSNGAWGNNVSISEINRSSSTVSNASASSGSTYNFGRGNNSAMGGLPRISGHSQPVVASSASPSSSHGQPQPAVPTPQTRQQQRHQQPSPRPPSRSSTLSPNAAAAAAAAAASLNVSPAAAVSAAQVAAQVAARPARRRGKLPKPTTDFLKDWLHRHSDHPYPSEEEKKQLCLATGLSMSQVSNWMINVSTLSLLFIILQLT